MAKDWLRFFFESMSGSQSYAGGGKAGTIENFPEWKGYRIEQNMFVLVDRYLVLPNGFSTGVTTVRSGTRLILQMQYGGFYPKSVTPFLRSVLKSQYEARELRGFRGPESFEKDGLVYRNATYNPPLGCEGENHKVYGLHFNSYAQSAGQEVIFRRKGKHLLPEGWHDYHYMVFKPDNKE